MITKKLRLLRNSSSTHRIIIFEVFQLQVTSNKIRIVWFKDETYFPPVVSVQRREGIKEDRFFTEFH